MHGDRSTQSVALGCCRSSRPVLRFADQLDFNSRVGTYAGIERSISVRACRHSAAPGIASILTAMA